MDERARYFRRLKRLRAAARRWSVLGGGLTAATAVLTPYAGVGLPDVFWAAGAGTSIVLAWWRWSDHRSHAALPPPPPVEQLPPGQKLTAAIERFPAGKQMMDEMRRQRGRYALRGSSVADAWDRLDRAAATLAGLSGRLSGPAEAVVLESAVAEPWLRDLGQRVASVEKALPISPPEQKPALQAAHDNLTAQFVEGVTAYERLVSAAAGYVAEDGHPLGDERHPTLTGLHEAADRMRGVAEGMSELRRYGRPAA